MSRAAMRLYRPEVLILDYGELGDVRAILNELGVFHAAEGDAGAVLDVALLVTSLARARKLRGRERELPAFALHLVVADAHHGDLDTTLAGVDCDFVVRRPVDTAILRLITQRAGYEGPERRRVIRVALGAPISLHTRGESRARDAILAQLSIDGCGLVTSFDLESGTPVTLDLPNDLTASTTLSLDLPSDLTASRSLRLGGRIALSREVGTADGPAHDLSVVFDRTEPRDRIALRALMEGQTIGFQPDPQPAPTWSSIDRGEGCSRPQTAERRAAVRQCFQRRVLGGGPGPARVLLGRDLSNAGMRVARDPDFSLGDAVRLALYAEASAAPLLIDAKVERADTDAWFLRFSELDLDGGTRLEEMLESLESREKASQGVVSELVERS